MTELFRRFNSLFPNPGNLVQIGMRRTNALLWLIIAIATLCLALMYKAVSDLASSPLFAEATAIRKIGAKIVNYAHEHSTSETESLTGKSIDDLVAMNVLSPVEAAYLRHNGIKFLGYDRDQVAANAPILDANFDRGSFHKRIVCYSDGTVKTCQPKDTQ